MGSAISFQPRAPAHYDAGLTSPPRRTAHGTSRPLVRRRSVRHPSRPRPSRPQYADNRELNFADTPGWGVGGGAGCDAYGANPRDDSAIGINSVVGSTLRCTARDFARLAYLWLNDGRWGSRQLVSADWMRLATARYQRDDGDTPMGYGLTFWVRDEIDDVPDDLYMSRGHNQNHSYVIPSLDLVVVRQGNRNRQPRGQPNFESTLIQKIVKALPRS